MSACYSPKDFGEGVVEDFRPFSIPWLVFFFFFSFVWVILDVCSLAVVKLPATELYVVFRDIPIPGCISTVFWELLSLGCWSRLSFCQEILELIPVLCLPIK